MTITDGCGEAVRSTIGLPVSIPIFFIGKNNVYVNGKTLLNLTYPVGSIYMSVNSTSPATLFGGTWQEITGRFLLAHDSSHPAASTGGEYQHTLIQDEIPDYHIGNIPVPVAANHWKWNNMGIVAYNLGNASNDKPGVYNNGSLTTTGGVQYSYQISSYGGEKSHNNTPPYLSVYMWKRTG